MTSVMNTGFGLRALVALTLALISPSAHGADSDDDSGAVQGIAIVTTNAVLIPAALTTLIGGAVSFGTDSTESPSLHLRRWSIANVVMGSVGTIATIVIGAMSVDDEQSWILYVPLGLLSATDLGLGIAGLFHERAPETTAWIPMPVVSVDPEGDVTGHLVFSGSF